MARYKLIGVTRSGHVVERSRKHDGAPPDSVLCSFGAAEGCALVIRYYPSKKGWRWLDIRHARQGGARHSSARRWWTGYERGSRFYPTEDAAVMAAIHLLQRQQELDLT